MAERSFAAEVQQLKLGEGDVFAGEGILAVTKALLQSGVAYVGGYQGSPVSHLMDVLADARETLGALGVHFESSTSEAAAAAMLGASVHYPLRGAITFKSTVGTNVASDALSNLASGGVTGGVLVLLGEDYGEGSSIIQERSHAFAMKSQMWLLDPRPDHSKLVDMVEHGFELSEATNTPVMLTMRVRACHLHGRFVAKDNRPPRLTLAEAIDNPRRDIGRMALAPSTFVHEHEKVEDRWPRAERHILELRLNETFGEPSADVGLIVQGGLYNTLIRALELLGLSDHLGNAQLPIYVLNVVYPLAESEVLAFCSGKRAVLMLEEGQPEFIEQTLHTIVNRHRLDTAVHGKDCLRKAGEYTTLAIIQGLLRFFEKCPSDRVPAVAPPAAVQRMLAPRKIPIVPSMPGAPLVDVPGVLPRPPSFCTGCPERPIFTALKMVEKEVGRHYVSADIGCHQFAALPPFDVGATSMGYGLGAAGAAALNVKSTERRTISVMGDGGFWHNGLTTGVSNAVFNQNDNLIVVIDNGYSAATGGQDIPSSQAEAVNRTTRLSIERALRGVGVEWVRKVSRTYDLRSMKAALREALTSRESGPKVVIAQSECMLNKQRRTKPWFRAQIQKRVRVEEERFGIDDTVCTGDHSCIRLSGCPSLSIVPSRDPLKKDPVATVLSSCVGCGLCGEVAHEAVLCPSFHKVRTVHNPGRFERLRDRFARLVIGRLQDRLARREFADA